MQRQVATQAMGSIIEALFQQLRAVTIVSFGLQSIHTIIIIRPQVIQMMA